MTTAKPLEACIGKPDDADRVVVRFWGDTRIVEIDSQGVARVILDGEVDAVKKLLPKFGEV